MRTPVISGLFVLALAASGCVDRSPTPPDTTPLLARGGVSGAPEARNFVAPLDGREEVPANDSRATGLTKFQLNKDEAELHYRLIVANIENVVAAHIHLGAPGVNGPVVAFLYGPAAPGGGRVQGVIAEGIITASDLIGPLAGQPLDALVDEMRSGNSYVNVHTNDGVDPPNTGPGDIPGGEIRGQIDPSGPGQ